MGKFWSDFTSSASENMGKGAQLGAEAAKMKLQAKLEEEREDAKLQRERDRVALKNKAITAAEGDQDYVARLNPLVLESDEETVRKAINRLKAQDKIKSLTDRVTQEKESLLKEANAPAPATSEVPPMIAAGLELGGGTTEMFMDREALKQKAEAVDLSPEEKLQLKTAEYMKDTGETSRQADIAITNESNIKLQALLNETALQGQIATNLFNEADKAALEAANVGSRGPEMGISNPGTYFNMLPFARPSKTAKRKLSPSDDRAIREYITAERSKTLTPERMKQILSMPGITTETVRGMAELSGKTPAEILSMAGMSERNIKKATIQDVTAFGYGKQEESF